jgi:ABC-type dipeptide/oligopeptide/nickel transport system ATPase component
VTALSILGLIPQPPGEIASGEIRFEGKDLLRLKPPRCAPSGNRIAMIFQEPMSSMNPALTVGKQIAEPIRIHEHRPWRDAYDEAVALLAQVQIPEPRSRVQAYPHQFSGGMRQRDDRDGIGLQAEADHRRRADHRARRHRAGADPGPAEDARAKVRYGADPDHA